VRVTFYVHDERKRISGWVAQLGPRRFVPGSLMGYGNGAPHDLVQYVIESATGYSHGFWGLVAKGATFKSTGRKRTKPGWALIAQHRAELLASEHLAGMHVLQWRCGVHTPVTAALDEAKAQWQDLKVGDEIVFEWPSPRGTIIRSTATVARQVRTTS
jgi:hypothetical protein